MPGRILIMRAVPTGTIVTSETISVSKSLPNAYRLNVTLDLTGKHPAPCVVIRVANSGAVNIGELTAMHDGTTARVVHGTMVPVVCADQMTDAVLEWLDSGAQTAQYVVVQTRVVEPVVLGEPRTHRVSVLCVVTGAEGGVLSAVLPLGVPNQQVPPIKTEINLLGRFAAFGTEHDRKRVVIRARTPSVTFPKLKRPHCDLVEAVGVDVGDCKQQCRIH